MFLVESLPMASFPKQVVTGFFGAFLAMIALGLGIVFLMDDPLPEPNPNQIRGVPGIAEVDAEPPEPVPARAQPPSLQPIKVERVDCLKNGAPKWCRSMRYATDGERKGTTVTILRAHEPGQVGEVHWCGDGTYVGDVGTYTSQEMCNELGAVAVTLEPRDAKPMGRYQYFLVPKDFDTSSWKWSGPCPFKE